MATISTLPFELLWAIYDQLDLTDRLNCALVSKEWHLVFNGLINSSLTLDSPELYWSFIETYYQQTIPYIRNLILVGIPIDLGLEVAIKHCIDLVAFTLRSLNPDDPMHALLLVDGDEVLSTPSTIDVRQPNITDVFISHSRSLTFLSLDFPTSAMSITVPTLFAVLPPGLINVQLHQITCPVNVLDLNLLYNTCHRLKEISLAGQEFTKIDKAGIQSAGILNGKSAPCSIVSLDLAFEKVESVRQIMALISVVRPDRHLDLRHFGLSLTPSKLKNGVNPSFELLTDDCPGWIYDRLVKQCSRLDSLSLKNGMLDGLIDAFERRGDNHVSFLRHLSISKDFCLNGSFVNKMGGSMAKNLVSLTLLGVIQIEDWHTLLQHLMLFSRLEHLDIDSFSQHTRFEYYYARHTQSSPWARLTPLSNEHQMDFTDIRPVTSSRVTQRMWSDIQQTMGHNEWKYMTDFPLVYIDARPEYDGWLSASSLVSLTLRQPYDFYSYELTWLTRRLQKVVICKVILDRSWMSILKTMCNLVELQLNQCTSLYTAMLLDISSAPQLERLELSHIYMTEHRKLYIHTQHLLNQLSLYQILPDGTYQKTMFPIKAIQPAEQQPKRQLIVVCNPIKTLIANQTKLLG